MGYILPDRPSLSLSKVFTRVHDVVTRPGQHSIKIFDILRHLMPLLSAGSSVCPVKMMISLRDQVRDTRNCHVTLFLTLCLHPSFTFFSLSFHFFHSNVNQIPVRSNCTNFLSHPSPRGKFCHKLARKAHWLIFKMADELHKFWLTKWMEDKGRKSSFFSFKYIGNALVLVHIALDLGTHNFNVVLRSIWYQLT